MSYLPTRFLDLNLINSENLGPKVGKKQDTLHCKPTRWYSSVTLEKQHSEANSQDHIQVGAIFGGRGCPGNHGAGQGTDGSILY